MYALIHIFKNCFAVVSDLLMNEAIANYARAKVEKSEDSGVESGHSLDNTGGVENTFFSSFLMFIEIHFRFREQF